MYTKPKMPARKKEHYLDNKKFLAELEKYRAKIARNEREGKPKPRVNNYIGGCFLKLLLIYHTDQTLSTTCIRMI